MVQVGLHLCSKVLAQIPQASALSKYQGPKPPWPYKGFTSFPAFYFGANESGLENASWLPFVAQHQVAGWGWQQNFRSVGQDRQRYFQQEVSLAQMATRMATYIEVTPKTPEKRLQEGRAGEGGHLERPPKRGGPLSARPGGTPVQLGTQFVAVQLGVNAVWHVVFVALLHVGGAVLDEEEGLAQYRAKLQLLRSLSLTLNRKKVWPIYSSYNGYSDLPWRKCLMPFDEYFNVLQDVGWIRFYEFGIGATSPSAAWDSQATLAQAMRESELGLPVMVRATPQAKLWWQEGRFGANKQPGAIRTRQISRCLRNAKSGASLPLGLFLLVQNDYWLLE
ncbi:unnamed protein product [Durusdinium trenchii]|uniref:Uncharacterized protein n=1 Tax=Durusdinium trenchii TaxID=1381693 RepID=A0ABP0N358_9DINO